MQEWASSILTIALSLLISRLSDCVVSLSEKNTTLFMAQFNATKSMLPKLPQFQPIIEALPVHPVVQKSAQIEVEKEEKRKIGVASSKRFNVLSHPFTILG